MKREIKFRGKQTHGDKWLYGYYFVYDSPTDNKTYHHIVPQQYSSKPSEYFICNFESIGQFSGLFDKNGKEIYEGDIIRHHDFSNVYKPDFDGEVIFIKSGFRIKFKSEYDKSGFMYWGLCFDDFANRKIEVIGNIHDNPDLLK